MRAIPRQPGSESPLGPARWAALVVCALTLMAALASLAVAAPPLLRAAGAVLALGLGAGSCRRLLRPRFDRLRIDGARVRLQSRDGRRREGRLAGAPFVSPLFVGFRWRPAGRRLPIATGVFSEQMAARDYRRLCALLRQGELR